MTFGNQEFPTTDHPFLRHSTDPEPQTPLGGSVTETEPLIDAPPGDDLMETVFEAMQGWDRFCVLALIIDSPASAPPSESFDSLVMDFISGIDGGHGTVGGHWKGRLYVGALPNVDMPAARELATTFVTRLAARRPETVSIGIAPFPLLAYDKQRTLANACKTLDHAAFLGPDSIVTLDAVTLNISGDRHYKLGQMDDAVAEYSAALELDPNNTNVRNSLGVCFAELNDMTAAEAEFRIVTEIDPAEPMAWYNLGLLSRFDGRDEASLEFFEKAYAFKSDFYEIPFQIGRLLSEQCRWDEALEFAEKAAMLSQGQWSAHSLMGLCLAAVDRIPEAIQAYTKSVKSNPNNAWDLSALGCLYDAENENPDICRTFFEQSIALAPDNGLFHNRLGQWHQKHRQFEEAMAAYRQADEWGHDSTHQMDALQSECQKASDHTSSRTG